MVGERALYGPGAVAVFAVAGVFFDGRNQRVPVFKIINLGGFQLHFVDADLFCEAVNFGDLMLVGPHDEELKNEVRVRFSELFLPFHHVFSALQHGFELATDSVTFISTLRSAIDRNDEAVEAGLDGAARVFVVQKMAVRGSGRENAFFIGVFDHFQKIRVDVRLALKVKNEVKQLAVQLVDGFSKKIGFQIAGRPRKLPQAARTFGAAEVAGRRRLDADGRRDAPLDGPSRPARQKITGQHEAEVPATADGHFSDETEAVVEVELHGGEGNGLVGGFAEQGECGFGLGKSFSNYPKKFNRWGGLKSIGYFRSVILGEILKKRTMKCNVCKSGDLLKGKTAVTLWRDTTVVVIEDVEALVCDNCGHYYLDSATSDRVLKTLDEAVGRGTKLEVLALKSA